MTKQEADFIGSMNMCDEISNEAYKKIMCNCEVEESEPITSPSRHMAKLAENFGEIAINVIEKIQTCGRCEYEKFPYDAYPCNQCKYGVDLRKNMWKLKDEDEGG